MAWMSFLLFFFTSIELWAKPTIPWEKIESSVERYGLLDHLVCAKGLCELTWKNAEDWVLDDACCSLKNKKITCRYPYHYQSL